MPHSFRVTPPDLETVPVPVFMDSAHRARSVRTAQSARYFEYLPGAPPCETDESPLSLGIVSSAL